MKTSLFVEFSGNQVEDKTLITTAKNAWVEEGNKVKDIKTLNIYIKPEENAAYYVINETCSGKIDL